MVNRLSVGKEMERTKERIAMFEKTIASLEKAVSILSRSLSNNDVEESKSPRKTE